MDHFELHSEYQPTGDQPAAIETLVKGFQEGNQFETLLGVTGSGKTFTMANVIQALNRPTLIISHNKTLAGQLYGEMKEFFPDNAVEYFVSYYDYYQPEAYVPQTDTYIAKDSAINDEIDKLRLSATASLSERRDVIVVASVSCIYGLGSPDEFKTGRVHAELRHVMIYPASHYVVPQEKINLACDNIEKELEERIRYFKGEDKLLEAQRISERTNFDIEMMRETGFCSGIENYSRHLNFMPPGAEPLTLMDFFPKDFLIIVDESHMTIPQIGAMYHGDRNRKQTLVDYGFRLPSALDNRPLKFEEFEQKIDQMLFVSATPGPYERDHELLRAEQVIRPTGLLDPEISVRPTEGQIDDLISEIRKETAKKNKVLVTTLTKKMAEDLTDYLAEAGIRVKYLHSDIDTLERSEIIRDMRLDVFDVLVGINLLREGLDIPEIALVAILDADKEGFLRSETALIQTIGRAARNSEGHVIMYADAVTDSMQRAIDETNRRRKIQQAYNEAHHITPTTIKKAVRDLISISKEVTEKETAFEKDPESMSKQELDELIAKVEKQMKKAAANLDFESAAQLRDRMVELKKHALDLENQGEN